MLKKIIRGNIKILLKCKILCIVEKNGKSWRVNFWKKNSNEVEVSWNFQKKASTVQDRSTKLKNELKNWKTKKLKKGVQMLVKLLMSEKSWNFKKKCFAGEKKRQLLKSAWEVQKAKIEKSAKKIENIEKLKRNLRMFIESFEKSLKGPKNCKFG